ncbi:unnamed protein product [Blepharisma stoltei]|uniref:Protein kinase domain-containing protein n=1 Tax=Blepharisma stoltei TaxID=1481888 RepID=A0AAU9JUB5_9CILI|nr:unnamed protein product [Blepharisma stoltei]
MEYYAKYRYTQLHKMPPNKRILIAELKNRHKQSDRVPLIAAVKEFSTIKHNYENEAKIFSEVSDMSHSIVKYYNHLKYDDKFFIFMEYCENGSISQSMKKLLSENTYWPLSWLVKQFKSITYALIVLLEHKISHRDIKPENIFVCKDWHFKLGDFGITRRQTGLSEETYPITGTILYMSPILLKLYFDKIQNSDKINLEKEDVWSLGKTFFEILIKKTGVDFQKYRGKSIQNSNKMRRCSFAQIMYEYESSFIDIIYKKLLKHDIPEKLALLIAQMLKTPYKDRPSLSDVYEGLERIQGEIGDPGDSEPNWISYINPEKPKEKLDTSKKENLLKLLEQEENRIGKVIKTYFKHGYISSEDDADVKTISIESSLSSQDCLNTLPLNDPSQENATISAENSYEYVDGDTVSEENPLSTESEIDTDGDYDSPSDNTTISNETHLAIEENLYDEKSKTLPETNNRCGLCGEWSDKDQIKLDCGHFYDVPCLSEYINYPNIRPHCPICKVKITWKMLSTGGLLISDLAMNKMLYLIE